MHDFVNNLRDLDNTMSSFDNIEYFHYIIRDFDNVAHDIWSYQV